MKYAFVMALAVLVAGCQSNSSEERNDVTYTTTLSLKDVFDQETSDYSFGETIRVYISLSSNSRNDELLIFPSSKLYDIYIINDSGDEVWRQSDMTTYAQAIREINLATGGINTFRDDLDRELFEGGGLPSGTYELFGFWVGYGEVVSSEFTVQ